MTAPEFKRLWRLPKRALSGSLFDPQTPRQRYLAEQSRFRYDLRPDAYPGDKAQLTGELGFVESCRIVTAPPLVDWIGRGYRAALRSGTSAITLGLDWAHDLPQLDIRPVEFYAAAPLPAWRLPALYTPAWRTWLQEQLDDRTAAAIALVVDRHIPSGIEFRTYGKWQSSD